MVAEVKKQMLITKLTAQLDQLNWLRWVEDQPESYAIANLKLTIEWLRGM